MPTTPRGVWTPDDSDDWDLVTDLAAMAVSIDSAITSSLAGLPLPARYLGTEADRAAMTAPNLRNGIEFQTTDTNLIYRRMSGAWTQSYLGQPFRQAAGTGTTPAAGTATVTFPAGRFTQPPIVNLTGTSARYGTISAPPTTSGFSLILANSSGAGVAGSFNWHAVQMTEGSAAG